jgi:spectinomycin phosphotransferase
MLEKPDLADEKIAASLEDNYGISTAEIEFLQLGADSNSWVYRVSAKDRNVYFLKAKKGSPYLPSLVIPRFLRDHGIHQAVAPLPSRSQALWQPLEGYALILYPFIEARSAIDGGMPEAQWVELGGLLKQIHGMRMPPDLSALLRRESFLPVWSKVFAALDEKIEAGVFTGPFEEELAAFWRPRREQIHRLLERTLELSQVLRAKEHAFVLCHADFHTANILYDGRDRLYIVDWDDPLLAPKERDLMFVSGTAGSSVGYTREQEQLFYRGYGEAELDLTALTYYQYDWAAQDLGDFGRRIFLDPQAGDETKAEALGFIISIFQPGETLDTAYRLDRELNV